MSSQPIVFICIIAVIVLSCLNFVLPDMTNKFGLVPVNTLITNYYSWNLITSCFFETEIIKIITELTIFYHISANLSIKSYENFFLYFAFTSLTCTIGTLVYCFVRFFATRLEEMILESVYGFGGILICFAMLSRQQFKNQSVILAFPFITYHNLPILMLSIQFVLWIAGLKQYANDILFTSISLVTSWSYLRFYYKFDDKPTYGDSSDDFSFVSMFPSTLHSVVIPFTTAFYNIVALTGLYPTLESKPVEKKAAHHLRYAEPTSQDSGTDIIDAVAERRRAKAIKLLDAKMAELEKEDQEGWEERGVSQHLDTINTRSNTGSDIEMVTESSSSGSGNGHPIREPFTIVSKS